MFFDQQQFSLIPGNYANPDWCYGGGPRPWPIEEVATIQGTNTQTTQYITGTVANPGMEF